MTTLTGQMLQIQFPMEAIVMIAAGVTVTVASVKAAILTSVKAIVEIKAGSAVVDSAMQKEEQAPSAKEEAAQVEAHPQEAPEREAQIRTQPSSATKRHTMRMKTTRFFSMRLAARVTFLTSSWRTMEPMKTS